MDNLKTIIDDAILKGQKTLSEYESKLFIKDFGTPVTEEILTFTEEEAVTAAEKIGYPVVIKGSGRALAHKTEMNMVRLGIQNSEELIKNYSELTSSGILLDGVLVQQTIRGGRELVIGMKRDPNFGPAVMFGIGGIFTEVLDDVSFRIAPLTAPDAYEMIDEIKFKKILGPFRGAPPVDRDILAATLIGIGDLAIKYRDINEIDINPMIVQESKPVAVDALIVLK